MRINFWKITSILFLSLFSLLTGELYLIYIGYPEHNCKTHPRASAEPIVRFDSDLGWSYIKKITGKSDGVFYLFNQEGYRTDTIKKKTDFSKPIILIVGDSMLFGHGLNFSNTFGYKLSKALDNKFEVLNFAVQGFGTDQMFLMLKRIFPIYKPDIVIADYIDEHLMRNVNIDRREIIPCMHFIGTKPLFEIKNGNLDLQHIPMLYKDYDRPLILSLFRDLGRKSIEIRAKKNGRKITAALLKEMKEYTQNRGSRFYLVNLSDKQILLDDNSGPSVLGMNIFSKPNPEYTLSGDDMHPNSTGTQIMVDEFIQQFIYKLRNLIK